MKDFYGSFLFSIVGLGLAYSWAGLPGVWIAALLSLMEVTLSFDNAVVNAAVLRQMEPKWQKRFMTWGILIAVFGMRLLFPLVIVAMATGLSIMGVGELALENPEEYSRHVMDAHISISAFGGMFLLMVFMHYFFDVDKDVHWLAPLEARLAQLGKLESVEVILAFLLLLALHTLLPEHERYTALLAGTVGIIMYVVVSSMTALMSDGDEAGAAMAYGGFAGFMYLQILDASFSLDGVIGALAMSKDIVIIMLGLGIGAFFVRSMTVYMVKKGTLDEFIYLEHGAHYGIGALAGIMLISMMVHVSEVITGLVGAGFIVFSLVSSIRHKKHLAG